MSGLPDIMDGPQNPMYRQLKTLPPHPQRLYLAQLHLRPEVSGPTRFIPIRSVPGFVSAPRFHGSRKWRLEGLPTWPSVIYQLLARMPGHAATVVELTYLALEWIPDLAKQAKPLSESTWSEFNQSCRAGLLPRHQYSVSLGGELHGLCRAVPDPAAPSALISIAATALAVPVVAAQLIPIASLLNPVSPAPSIQVPANTATTLQQGEGSAHPSSLASPPDSQNSKGIPKGCQSLRVPSKSFRGPSDDRRLRGPEMVDAGPIIDAETLLELRISCQALAFQQRWVGQPLVTLPSMWGISDLRHALDRQRLQPFDGVNTSFFPTSPR